MNTDEPSLENRYLCDHADLILSSFLRITGKNLIDLKPGQDSGHAVYEAGFCVLSHDTAPDPVFNYGNRAAQELFEMSWEQLIGLPSRLSAEAPLREERQRLLNNVAEKGYIDDYKGIRISSSGKRFIVEKAVIWNLIDDDGMNHGQAAVLYEWSALT